MDRNWFSAIPIKTAIFFIKAYQMLTRGVLPPSCRYLPSCSDFSVWAIRSFGLSKGLTLGLKRIMTCHPFYGR